MVSEFGMRRRWMVGAASIGAFVLAVPARADVRAQAMPNKKSAEGTITATERLTRNVGVLLRVLLVYEAGSRRLAGGEDIDPAVFTQAAEVMRDFIHDFHEKQEEELVYPRFKKAGRMVDLAEVMVGQHAAGRRLTEIVLKAAPNLKDGAQRKVMTDAMQATIVLYRPHAARELTDILPTLRSLVTPNEFDELGAALAKEETTKLGADGFEKMAKAIEQLEKRIGVNDLSQFTPKT